jgi:hypothetical protein
MKRRAAVEPIIGHLKAEHRMGRNYLKGHQGDKINAVLAAAGFNFHLLIRWFAKLLRAFFQAILEQAQIPQMANLAISQYFTDDMVEALDGRLLDSPVHTFDLTVGPRMLWFGQAMIDAGDSAAYSNA